MSRLDLFLGEQNLVLKRSGVLEKLQVGRLGKKWKPPTKPPKPKVDPHLQMIMDNIGSFSVMK